MRILLALLLIALLPARVEGQDVVPQDVRDRHTITPGLVYERHDRSVRHGRTIIETIELDPLRFFGSLEWREASAVTPIPMRDAAPANAARSVFAFGLEKSAMIANRGALRRWPPEGPVLLRFPEGTLVLEELPTEPFHYAFDEGTSGTLRIGLEAIRLEQATLIPGPCEAESLRAAVPRGMQARRITIEGSVSDALWSAMISRSVLELPSGTPMEGFQPLAGNEAILLFPTATEVPEEGSVLRISGYLPLLYELAEQVVATGPWLRRGGRELTSGLSDEDATRNAFALDAFSGRAWFLTAPFEGRGQVAATDEDWAAFAQRKGATDMVLLDEGAPALVADLGSAAWRDVRGRQPAVTMLLFREESAARHGNARTGAWKRVGIESFGLQPPELLAHPKSALADLRVLPGGAADGFWSGRIDRGKPESAMLDVMLAGRVRVRGIEFLHAELAGFSPDWNLKGAIIHARDRPTDPWTRVAEFSSDSPRPRQRILFPLPPLATQLRIEITEPSFVSGGDMARLAEIIVWEE